MVEWEGRGRAGGVGRGRVGGVWHGQVGGDSTSSAGNLPNGCRPPGAQNPDFCSRSKEIPAFLRAPITGQQRFLCFYFIYCCLNTLTRRIHHRCKHTENFNTIYCESSSQKNQVGNTEEGRLLVTEEEWKERENDREEEGKVGGADENRR